MAHAVDANLHAFVHEPVGMHTRADARLVKQIDGDLFDNAGADAVKDVFAGLPLDDDVIDAVFMEKLTEQQARGAGTDDRDLGSHVSY